MIPNYEQLVRLLRNVVSDDMAGCTLTFPTMTWECRYCNVLESWDGDLLHAEDCPIGRAREALIAYDLMMVAGYGPREDQEHKEYGR